MNKKKLIQILKVSLGLLTLSIILVGVWAVRLNSKIQEQLKNGWFLSPTEIYSAPLKFTAPMNLPAHKLSSVFEQEKFRKRDANRRIRQGDWAALTRDQCLEEVADAPGVSDVNQCLKFRLRNSDSPITMALFNEMDQLIQFWDPIGKQVVEKVEFPPTLFAQYYGENPVMRRVINVAETPLQCLQAVTAIEDSKFLEHQGVSITGTLRAVFKNVVKGKYAEGGSTITQQLVKNYFLSPEKTIQRKITEQLMAVLLEMNVDKDTILENYLNVIYMGANGPFQVRGFGAAANHYFSKDLENLDLSECALLAAIVNSPGRYNPFRKPENAKKRRDHVLDKMQFLKILDEETVAKAKLAPLPEPPTRKLSEPAPYFIQAIRRKLADLKIDTSEGAKIYTSLNVEAQELAQTLVAQKVVALEEWFKHLAKIRESGKELQASLVAVDVETAEVIALVGGRTFQRTQFNRILDAKRQVGSTMKPFVYLTALENFDEEGKPYSPMSILSDEPLTHKYEGQAWSPKNYSGKFHGHIPMFYALINSINVATARLGIQVGLEAIVDIAKRYGITSPIEPFPSLTLGAFEITPWEMTRAYTGLARMGSRPSDLHLIQKIENYDGKILFGKNSEFEQVSNQETVAALVGMMKNTLKTGTARASEKMGWYFPAAGKTGTTSDAKDAWFIGFSPKVLTAVWIGYDDNTQHGLTGASGALPLWVEFMKGFGSRYGDVDFKWPEGTYSIAIKDTELMEKLPEDAFVLPKTELIFRSSDESFGDQ